MKRILLSWFPIVALMISLNLLSCGGGGGGASPVNSSFGTGGIVTTAIGTARDEAHALAIQSDGKLVAAGDSHKGTQNVFALARYLPNGDLDGSFGGGGIVTTAIGTVDDEAFALKIDSDDKLVAAGRSKIMTTNGNVYEFALVRYNTDGTRDTTFNPTGTTQGVVT